MTRSASIFAGTLMISIIASWGAQAGNVYIPEGSAGEVVIVDDATDHVVGRIAGLPDVHGLGGAPGAPYLVAGSYAETAADQMPAIARPSGLSEDEHAAHHRRAADTASPTGAVSILTIIRARDGSVVRRLEVPGAVHHVAVSPDGRHAIATHPNANGVSVVDLTDFTVRPLVPTGPMPNYAAFSHDGTKAYVSNSGNGTVSELDTERWFVQRKLLAGDAPEHIVLAPNGRTLYVANVEAGTVSALDLDRGKLAASFAIGGRIAWARCLRRRQHAVRQRQG